MPLQVRIEAPSLSSDAVNAFRADVRLCFAIYRGLRRRYRLPACDITALLAEDFVRAVNSNLRGAFRIEEGGSFDANRVGGVVAAKNLDQTDDAGRVVVVFDAALWTNATEPAVRASLLHLVAHEMAHPVIERARYVAGVLDDMVRPSVTADLTMRSMARIMAGEYRADGLADLVLGQCMTVGTLGDTQPATQWALRGHDYLENVRAVVERVHPAWPDLVQAYREWRIPIEELWASLMTSIDQTLTMIVHSQAAADAAEIGMNILEEPAVAQLPATRLYLAPTWSTFLAALRQQPLLSPIKLMPEIEERVTASGAASVRTILRLLGVIPVDHGDGTWGIEVQAPIR